MGGAGSVRTRYLDARLDLREAAAICGCAVGTIKSRVGRARAALTEMLANGAIPRRATDDAVAHRAILEELDEVAAGNGVSSRP